MGIGNSAQAAVDRAMSVTSAAGLIRGRDSFGNGKPAVSVWLSHRFGIGRGNPGRSCSGFGTAEPMLLSHPGSSGSAAGTSAGSADRFDNVKSNLLRRWDSYRSGQTALVRRCASHGPAPRKPVERIPHRPRTRRPTFRCYKSPEAARILPFSQIVPSFPRAR